MDPSPLGSLKGLNGTRNTRFILVRPLTVKVKAYDPVVVELIGLDEQGANPLYLSLELLFLVPEPPPGHPFIYTG